MQVTIFYFIAFNIEKYILKYVYRRWLGFLSTDKKKSKMISHNERKN